MFMSENTIRQKGTTQTLTKHWFSHKICRPFASVFLTNTVAPKSMVSIHPAVLAQREFNSLSPQLHDFDSNAVLKIYN